MERREFLARTGAAAGFVLAGSRAGGFVSSSLAAGGTDGKQDSFEQKLAEFALAIRYEDLPREVIASAKRVLLDTLACAFGAVGTDAAAIAEKTIRKTFGGGRRPRSSAIRGPPPSKAPCSSTGFSSALST